MKRITYIIMPYKTVIRLFGRARNPANGFPARLLGVPRSCRPVGLGEQVKARLPPGMMLYLSYRYSPWGLGPLSRDLRSQRIPRFCAVRATAGTSYPGGAFIAPVFSGAPAHIEEVQRFSHADQRFLDAGE